MPIGQSGLKGKSKVMVMGKKVNSGKGFIFEYFIKGGSRFWVYFAWVDRIKPKKAEETLINGLKPMKSDYDTKKAKLDAAAGQVKNYENGFLQETKQLDKEIMTIAEYLMRILEKLDGYQIAEVNITQTSAGRRQPRHPEFSNSMISS